MLNVKAVLSKRNNSMFFVMNREKTKNVFAEMPIFLVQKGSLYVGIRLCAERDENFIKIKSQVIHHNEWAWNIGNLILKSELCEIPENDRVPIFVKQSTTMSLWRKKTSFLDFLRKGFVSIEAYFWNRFVKKQVIALLQSRISLCNEDLRKNRVREGKNSSQTNNLQSSLDNEIVAQV